MSIRNLLLTGGLALSLAGCDDGKDKTIETLAKENQALRQELEAAKQPEYALPQDCEGVIGYQHVTPGNTFVINDIIDGKMKSVFAVNYQYSAKGWGFIASSVTGSKVEQLHELLGARGEHLFIRFRTEGRDYALFFRPQPDDSVNVAYGPEPCVGKIQLSKIDASSK
jgi:hypothetical protein